MDILAFIRHPDFFMAYQKKMKVFYWNVFTRLIAIEGLSDAIRLGGSFIQAEEVR